MCPSGKRRSSNWTMTNPDIVPFLLFVLVWFAPARIFYVHGERKWLENLTMAPSLSMFHAGPGWANTSTVFFMVVELGKEMDKKEEKKAQTAEDEKKVTNAEPETKAEEQSVKTDEKLQETEKQLEETQAKVTDLTKQLAAATEKVSALQRYAADLDNSRKRALAETDNEVSRMKESILKELLPTLDEFELAVKSAEIDKDKNYEKMLEGIQMVQKNLYRRLADKYGLEKMEPEGTPFDPMQHEAIMMEKGDQFKTDTVTQSLVSGYKLGGKVLRAAKVKVGKPN